MTDTAKILADYVAASADLKRLKAEAKKLGEQIKDWGSQLEHAPQLMRVVAALPGESRGERNFKRSDWPTIERIEALAKACEEAAQRKAEARRSLPPDHAAELKE